MKHLKRFNESIEKSDIEDICNYLEYNFSNSKLINISHNDDGMSSISISRYHLLIDNIFIDLTYQYNGVGGILISKGDDTKLTHSGRLLSAIKNYSTSPIYLFGVYLIKELSISYDDLIPRIEEFEIFVDNKVDLISLNAMYDYYKKTFNQRNVTKKLTHIGIKYIG